MECIKCLVYKIKLTENFDKKSMHAVIKFFGIFCLFSKVVSFKTFGIKLFLGLTDFDCCTGIF